MAIKSFLSFVSFVYIISSFMTCAFAGEDFETAREFTFRDGLPNFYKKLCEAKDPVKIAYFGGSITAQKGWRCHSLQYFKKRFPKAEISEINAAIGGTGSGLGAFRLEKDVLKFKPDLVFVEFATNDSGTPPKQIKKNMEGIVRHIWRDNPRTDICFVYTVTFSSLPTFRDGKNTGATETMERIAARYGIPTINMSLEIAALEKNGKLVMKTSDKPIERVSGAELDTSSEITTTADGKIPFSSDGVHPHINTGHVLYERALERSFAKLEKLAADKPHVLGEPMSASCIENGRMVSFEDDKIKKEGAWRITDNPTRIFKSRMKSVLEFEPGASVSFKYRGCNLAVYHIMGNRGGSVDIFIDGKFVKNEKCFDGYTGDRVNSFEIMSLESPKTVEVKIVVSDKTYDKRSLLRPKYVHLFEKRQNEFKQFKFNPGELLIDGELLN